ncbi:SGNH/GDSL hydrolase family protein [Celeribacter sp.]|uniref:SGNH/GDSL hydrolase family protein n=1 Tax=Celeribacter sp. TaxID=1890673 RepID=UPI003A8E62FB
MIQIAAPATVLRAMAFAFALFATYASPLCAETPRILMIGDSMLASHREKGAAVGDALAEALGEPVRNMSKNGAKVIHALPLTGAMGMRISAQVIEGTWDWVVVNGGGNDLMFACGCRACDTRIERMIGADGAMGKIPELIAHLRSTGARVVYVGYLRSPGIGSLIEGCADEGDTLEARLAAMARRDRGVYFVPLTDIVPEGDRSFHTRDRIHPSVKGAAAIAARIADVIRKADKTR